MFHTRRQSQNSIALVSHCHLTVRNVEACASRSWRSTRPDLCNLLNLTISLMNSTPDGLLNFALVFVVFKWTPRIQLTIILSVLSTLVESPTCIGHVSLANSHCEYMQWIFSFTSREVIIDVNTADSSLNQAQRILALSASSTYEPITTRT